MKTREIVSATQTRCCCEITLKSPGRRVCGHEALGGLEPQAPVYLPVRHVQWAPQWMTSTAPKDDAFLKGEIMT